MSTRVSAYERQCAEAIRDWLDAPPDWGTRVMSRPSRMAALAAQYLVPPDLLRATLRTLDRTAGRLAGSRDVLRWAGASHLAELGGRPLREADQLALRVERRAMALAGSSGAAFGIGGALALAADVPSLLTMALRTIHRTAYCYGENWQTHEHRGLSIGVFALASANTMEEKWSAWNVLHGNGELLDTAWRDGVERVAERELAKDAAQFSMQTLSRRVGRHIGARKTIGLAPVIGALIGGTVNAGYIHDIAKVTRHVLHDRWLRQRHPRMHALQDTLHAGKPSESATAEAHTAVTHDSSA